MIVIFVMIHRMREQKDIWHHRKWTKILNEHLYALCVVEANSTIRSIERWMRWIREAQRSLALAHPCTAIVTGSFNRSSRASARSFQSLMLILNTFCATLHVRGAICSPSESLDCAMFLFQTANASLKCRQRIVNPSWSRRTSIR